MSSARPFPVPKSATTGPCRVLFGASATAVGHTDGELLLQVALPVLGGHASETLLPAGSLISRDQPCTVFTDREEIAGFALAPAGEELEFAAFALYRRIFAAAAGRRLCRIWNYVPQINAVPGGLENYRRFCRGRSRAFEEHFGTGFERELPSASAVGVASGPLAVAFLATTAFPQHFENPRQVPAFSYPADYGPRPPSFSRATLVRRGTSARLFISGTAAIRGHATIAPDDLERQLPCTLENLQAIARAAGAGPAIGAVEGWQRSFKVYLRHAADFRVAARFLEQHLLSAEDAVTYLQADLCRADLRVEIEAVLHLPNV